MSKLELNQKGRKSVSQQMALLHLRWQQIRWELLQQASLEISTRKNSQSAHAATHEEGYASA